jgi:hypothetical protein
MKGVILVCAILGFLGAAMFYANRIGLDLEKSYLCPACPHVSMLNVHPVLSFLMLTSVMGAPNALILSTIGCGMWALVRRARQVLNQRVRSDAKL